MRNYYTTEEISQIIKLTDGKCYCHDNPIEVQNYGDKPYFVCNKGHHYTPEYYWARIKSITVEQAIEELSSKLDRMDLLNHIFDFHCYRQVSYGVPSPEFSPSLEYWQDRNVSEDTLKLFKVGNLNHIPTVPFFDIEHRFLGYFCRRPEVAPNTPFRGNDQKCFHLPQTNWQRDNLHCPPSLKPEDQNFVVVVEGILDVMKCHDAGYWAVAINGATLSRSQVAELRILTHNLVLFTDNDDAGQIGIRANNFPSQVSPFFNTKMVIPFGAKDPNGMTVEDIQEIIGTKPFSE